LLKYSQNTAGDYFYLPHPVSIISIVSIHQLIWQYKEM